MSKSELILTKPRLLPIKDAAAYIGLPRSTIFDFLKSGKLTRVVHGARRVLIRTAELDALADEIERGLHATGPAAA